jgi:RNA polymerase sigma factor (sigma-70 family)
LGEEEAFTLEDLIPGSEWTDVLDQLEADEQRDRLLSLLGELPAAQRQAFLLHALQNYTTAEIAQLQDRPESEVKADIEAARQTLRERLLAAGDVRATAASAARGRTVGTDASTPQG